MNLLSKLIGSFVLHTAMSLNHWSPLSGPSLKCLCYIKNLNKQLNSYAKYGMELGNMNYCTNINNKITNRDAHYDTQY